MLEHWLLIVFKDNLFIILPNLLICMFVFYKTHSGIIMILKENHLKYKLKLHVYAIGNIFFLEIKTKLSFLSP